MKKLIAVLSLVAVATLSYGQGQIAFANGGTTLISTNATTGGLATGPTSNGLNNFYYALFYSTTATTVGTMTQLGSIATNTAAVGRMTGGSGAVNSPALAGITAGTMVNFIVVGWSANIGNTYAAANAFANDPNRLINGWVGQSGLGNLIVGGGATPIPTLMGTTALASGQNQIGAFTLNFLVAPVPEPGTMVLAGLGGLAMLGLRRKK